MIISLKKYLFTLLTFVLFIVQPLFLNGQDNDVPELKTWEDINSKLYVSKVIEFEGKSQKDLIVLYKNWASIAFVNLKEVLVGETESQVVIRYILNTSANYKIMGMKGTSGFDWYVRLIAQFKEGKVKVSFYDEGNVPTPSTSINGIIVPGSPSGSYYVCQQVNKPKDLNKVNSSFYQYHLMWQNKVDDMVLAIETQLKNPYKLKDDF
jgi:hypothetical protein